MGFPKAAFHEVELMDLCVLPGAGDGAAAPAAATAADLARIPSFRIARRISAQSPFQQSFRPASRVPGALDLAEGPQLGAIQVRRPVESEEMRLMLIRAQDGDV